MLWREDEREGWCYRRERFFSVACAAAAHYSVNEFFNPEMRGKWWVLVCKLHVQFTGCLKPLQFHGVFLFVYVHQLGISICYIGFVCSEWNWRTHYMHWQGFIGTNVHVLSTCVCLLWGAIILCGSTTCCACKCSLTESFPFLLNASTSQGSWIWNYY